MLWLWILLAALCLVVLLLLGAVAFFFKFSICRYKTEGREDQYQEKNSVWHPFGDRMAQAQEFIRSHTTERPTITSFDGLKLRALYLPAQGKAKGTIVAFHGYRSLAPIDFALEVEFFHTLGYDVLLPYQRSHGLSRP